MALGKFDGIADTNLGAVEGVAAANINKIMGSDLSAGASVPFETEWTVNSGQSVTLPLVQNRSEGALAYNCTVDWGDSTPTSTVTSYNDANRIHTYTNSGTYRIKITGTMEGWSFNNLGDKLYIVRIINWGNSAGFNGFKYLKNGFWGCINLTSMGTGKILASGTGVLTDGFSSLFRACNKLASITSGLFDNHPNPTLNAFSYAFNGCTSITSIPANLFDFATLATTSAFNSTFLNCTGLTSIPTDLFKFNILVTTAAFSGVFQGCTGITAIPTDLFRFNTLVSLQGFYGAFQNTKITSIPTDLFRYNVNASSTSFWSSFTGCTSLIEIPADIFKYNTLVASFNQTFKGCTSLTAIPANMFDANTAVTDFTNVFQDCTGITSVPTDLFKLNTAALYMGGAFRGCTGLTTVPADLFRYNTAAINFSFTFNGCVNLQLNSWIFYATGEETTRFLNKSIAFTSCFNRVSFSGTQGTAPALWDCDFGTGVITKTTCYGGAGNSLTSLTNYADTTLWR